MAEPGLFKKSKTLYIIRVKVLLCAVVFLFSANWSWACDGSLTASQEVFEALNNYDVTNSDQDSEIHNLTARTAGNCVEEITTLNNIYQGLPFKVKELLQKFDKKIVNNNKRWAKFKGQLNLAIEKLTVTTEGGSKYSLAMIEVSGKKKFALINSNFGEAHMRQTQSGPVEVVVSGFVDDRDRLLDRPQKKWTITFNNKQRKKNIKWERLLEKGELKVRRVGRNSSDTLKLTVKPFDDDKLRASWQKDLVFDSVYFNAKSEVKNSREKGLRSESSVSACTGGATSKYCGVILNFNGEKTGAKVTASKLLGDYNFEGQLTVVPDYITSANLKVSDQGGNKSAFVSYSEQENGDSLFEGGIAINFNKKKINGEFIAGYKVETSEERGRNGSSFGQANLVW